MKIGIIGTGNMGRALGIRFTQLGHEVLFGSRNIAQGEDAAALAGGVARSGSNDEAARHGDVLIWTIRDTDPAAVLKDSASLDAKIIINLNNRDLANEVKTGAWFGEAIGEVFQAKLPRSHVVKALNLVAMETLDTSPDALRAAGAQLFIAGDDTAAKTVVAGLLAELGFESIDVGSGPVAMRAVEALGDVIRLLMGGASRGSSAHLRLITLPKPTLNSVGTRQESSYH